MGLRAVARPKPIAKSARRLLLPIASAPFRNILTAALREVPPLRHIIPVCQKHRHGAQIGESKVTPKEAIYDSLVRGDATKFDNLLDRHPELWSESEGVYYLLRASGRGQLGIIERLIRRGISINAPTDTSGPEGAVVSAADSGHVEVTQWLLDQGAVVNHIVGGKTRCFALTGAVVGGYFDVVTLLIERGADVNATGGQTTPPDYAVGYNQPEIAEYLRTVGGKLPDELA